MTIVSIVALWMSSQSSPTMTPSPDVRVSHDGDWPHVETTIASNPRNPHQLLLSSVVFDRADTSSANSRAEVKTYSSHDGGATWTATRIPEQWQYGGYNARVAFGPSGKAYVTAISGGPTTEQRCYSSTDGGLTWGAPVKAGVGGDYPTLAVDPASGAVHITHTRNTGNPPTVSKITLFRSADEGASWSSPFFVTRSDPSTTGNWGLLNMNSTVLKDGTLVVSYWDMPSGTGTYQFRMISTSDGGATFSAPRDIALNHYGAYASPAPGAVVAAHGSNSNCARIAADPRDDTLYASWTDEKHGKYRLQWCVSRDRGQTWSGPKRVDPSVPAGSSQVQSQIAVNKDGVVGLVWFDTRNFADKSACEVFFTASTDGGRTFLAPIRISSRPSTPRNWPDPNQPSNAQLGYASERHVMGGDYIGLTSDANGVFHAAWPDARTGVFQVWTAKVAVAVPASAPAPSSADSGHGKSCGATGLEVLFLFGLLAVRAR